MLNPLRTFRLLLAASGIAAGSLAATAAQAAPADDTEGGVYVSVSGGMAQPLGNPAVAGTLSAGSVTIPFDGAVDYGNGWTLRVALGFAERGGETATAGSRDLSDFRVEAEYVALRLKRRGFTAGALQAQPNDHLAVNAVLANAQARLIGKGPVRLWAGAGIGYARAALPDGQNSVACSCLRAAEGSGVTYQGKLLGEASLAPKVQLFAEWAALRVPALRTAQQPGVTYQAHWAGTAAGGLRVSF